MPTSIEIMRLYVVPTFFASGVLMFLDSIVHILHLKMIDRILFPASVMSFILMLVGIAALVARCVLLD